MKSWTIGSSPVHDAASDTTVLSQLHCYSTFLLDQHFHLFSVTSFVFPYPFSFFDDSLVPLYFSLRRVNFDEVHLLLCVMSSASSIGRVVG